MPARAVRTAGLVCALLCLCACATKRVTLEDLEAEIERESAALVRLEAAAAPRDATGANDAPLTGLPLARPGAPLPFYQTARPRLEIPATRPRDREQRALVERLSSEGATGFSYVGEAGSTVCSVPCDAAGLDRVPLSVLHAAGFAAGRELRGAEIDLIVRVGSRGYLVTVWHEHDGRVVAQDAPLVELPTVGGPAPSLGADELSLRYGLAGIDDGSRPWAYDERELLALALSLLQQRELELLGELTFRREAAPPQDAAGSDLGCAQTAAGIDVYDMAFADDDHGFEGVLRSPYPSSAHAILHQIAHVIAAARPGLRAGLVEEHAASVGQAKQQLKRLRNRSADADPDRVAWLSRKIADLERRLERLAAAAAPRVSEEGALDRFARIFPVGSGPTPYGRASLEESFAEAFALCRLDAEACRRISFDLLAFFSAERHLPAR